MSTSANSKKFIVQSKMSKKYIKNNIQQNQHYNLAQQNCQSISYLAINQQQQHTILSKNLNGNLSDNRVQIKSNNAPYTSIGVLQIEYKFKNSLGRQIKKYFQGTGFLIKHNIVLTCSHNIYSRVDKLYANSIKFTPGISTLQKLTSNSLQAIPLSTQTYQAIYSFIPYQFQSSQYGKQQQKARENDYAILVLNTIDPLATKYSKFQLKQSEVCQWQDIAVCGFPYDKKNLKFRDYRKYRLFGSTGFIQKIDFEKNRLRHNVDTSQAQSGSPIFQCYIKLKNQQQVDRKRKENMKICDKNKMIIKPSLKGNFQSKVFYQLIGIHTGGTVKSNYGILINKKVENRINFWIQHIQHQYSQKHQFQLRTFSYQNDQLQKRTVYSRWLVKHRTYSKKLSQLNKFYNYFQIPDAQHLHRIGFQQHDKICDLKKALRLYRKSLDMYTRSGKSQLLNCSLLLNKIGIIYYSEGQYNIAQECFKRANQIRKNQAGELSIMYSETISNLGNIHRKNGQTQKAMNAYLRALNIKQQIKGRDNIQCLPQINNIGLLYQKDKNYDKAIEMYQKALNICTKNLGKMSIRNCLYLNNLGSVYYFFKQKKDIGKKYLSRSVQLFQKNQIKQHLHYALTLLNLGSINQSQGRYQSAYKINVQVKQMLQRILGKNSQHKWFLQVCDKVVQMERNIIKKFQ